MQNQIVPIVLELRRSGYPLKEVSLLDFPPDRWTVRETDLFDCNIHPKAREGAVILKSHVPIKRWWLYEEIERPLVVPWKALAYVTGAGIVLVGSIALLPFVLIGVAIVGALAIDPVLVGESEDGCLISCGWWWHSFGK